MCVSRGSILYTIVLECVRERECVCVLECIRLCVCVCRGTGSRNRVEERGCELESEYEITRRRYSSLLVDVTRRRYTSYMINT